MTLLQSLWHNLLLDAQFRADSSLKPAATLFMGRHSWTARVVRKVATVLFFSGSWDSCLETAAKWAMGCVNGSEGTWLWAALMSASSRVATLKGVITLPSQNCQINYLVKKINVWMLSKGIWGSETNAKMTMTLWRLSPALGQVARLAVLEATRQVKKEELAGALELAKRWSVSSGPLAGQGLFKSITGGEDKL